MTIKILIKNQYGKNFFYPDCEKSELFCEMLKQKTLTQQDLEKIKQLGFEIIASHEQIKF